MAYLTRKNNEITLGSLFDGAGTCPFAGQLYGVKTLWASEIEPFPVQVTAKRFPNVKQLGDITKINGAEIDPVDIVTFGSPCQNLSVAGKQEGITGEKSSLFMEAVRVIKEMLNATKGKYPRFAMWENVPGAFSSNKGEDFQIVLEKLCQIKDERVSIPKSHGAGGGNDGNVQEVSWEKGIPSRGEHLIHNIGEFPNVVVESTLSSILEENVPKKYYFSARACQGVLRRAAKRGRKMSPLLRKALEQQIERTGGEAVGIDPYNQTLTGDKAATLGTNCGFTTGRTAVIAIDRAAFNQGENAKYNIGIDESGVAFTVVAKGPGAVCYGVPLNFRPENMIPQKELGNTLCNGTAPGTHNGIILQDGDELIVRRHTPRECGRLQGMPDWWCSDIPHKDAPEYKMWGNGMALPTLMYVMEGMATVLRKERLNELFGRCNA